MAPRDGLDQTSQSTAVNDDLPESLTDPVTIDFLISPYGRVMVTMEMNETL